MSALVLAGVVAGVLVLAVLFWTGARLLLAGRQLDAATVDRSRIPVAPADSTAAEVDSRLQRVRAAVESLVVPDTAEGLHPSAGALRERAQTYVVLGAGLLGVAVTLVAGFLLVV